MQRQLLSRQIGAAMVRYAALQRRAAGSPRDTQRLLSESLHELSDVLDELQVTYEQLSEQFSQLENSRQELKTERQRYRALFDTAPDAYILTDGAGTILEANRAASELLNLSVKFLRGKPLVVFVASDRPGFLTALDQVAAQGSRRNWMVTLRPRERSTFDAMIHVTSLPSAGDEGSPLHWLIRPVARSTRDTPTADEATEPSDTPVSMES